MENIKNLTSYFAQETLWRFAYLKHKVIDTTYIVPAWNPCVDSLSTPPDDTLFVAPKTIMHTGDNRISWSMRIVAQIPKLVEVALLIACHPPANFTSMHSLFDWSRKTFASVKPMVQFNRLNRHMGSQTWKPEMQTGWNTVRFGE